MQNNSQPEYRCPGCHMTAAESGVELLILPCSLNCQSLIYGMGAFHYVCLVRWMLRSAINCSFCHSVFTDPRIRLSLPTAYQWMMSSPLMLIMVPLMVAFNCGYFYNAYVSITSDHSGDTQTVRFWIGVSIAMIIVMALVAAYAYLEYCEYYEDYVERLEVSFIDDSGRQVWRMYEIKRSREDEEYWEAVANELREQWLRMGGRDLVVDDVVDDVANDVQVESDFERMRAVYGTVNDMINRVAVRDVMDDVVDDVVNDVVDDEVNDVVDDEVNDVVDDVQVESDDQRNREANETIDDMINRIAVRDVMDDVLDNIDVRESLADVLDEVEVRAVMDGVLRDIEDEEVVDDVVNGLFDDVVNNEQ